MGYKIKGFLLSLAFSLSASGVALAAPEFGDYNGDGKSDYALALVNRAVGSTAWLARHSSESENDFTFHTFNVPGDALVHGHWFGDNKYYPGVVFVRSATAPLEWHIKTPQAGEILLNYGLPGDNIVNQGDLDCDGITDLVVSRKGRSNYYPGLWLWYAALSSAGGQVQELAFGLSTDRIGLGDTDGDKCMELVALRAGFTWYSKKLFNPNVTTVQWGLPGDIPLWPQNGNYFVVRPTPFGQIAYVRHSNGGFYTERLGSNSAIPYVGKFTSNYGFAWNQRDTGWSAVRKEGGSDSVFRHGVSTNAIISPIGEVIQPNDDGRFSESTGGGGGGDGSCSVTQQMGDVSGDLWKPSSDNTGRVVLLFNSSYFHSSKRIEGMSVTGNDGSKVADGKLRGCCHNGNRTHWDLNKTASQLSSAAPLTVRMTLQNGTTECRTVPDPRRRWE